MRIDKKVDRHMAPIVAGRRGAEGHNLIEI